MNPRILFSLALAVALLATALAVAWAKSGGLIDDNLGDRIVMAVIGLVVAASNNAIPKQLAAPLASMRAEAVAQSVRRMGGWAMTLAGLAWAAIWALAPMALANPLAISVMVVALVVTVGHGCLAWRRYRRLENA